MIEQKMIWRCDRRGCGAVVDAADGQAPKGWKALEIRESKPYGASRYRTFCPDHIAELDRVLDVDRALEEQS